MTPGHTRDDFDCPQCKERFTTFTFLAPDPQQRAKRLNAQKIASWQRSHVCRRRAGA